MGVVRGGGLGCLRERAWPRERVLERVVPGAAAWEVESRLAGVLGESAGDVEEAVAQPFRFAAGELAGEEEPLCRGEQR